MKKIRLAITATIIFLALTSSTTTCSLSDVTIIGNQYSVPLINYGGWTQPTEYYTGLWVMKDGGFFRTDYHSALQPLTLTQAVAGNVLAFTTVSNRKGDDNDKKKISGGYGFNPGNAPADLLYTSFPINQHLNTGSAITFINTDHSSNYGLRSNEFMLVITINNDSNRLATIDSKVNDALKYKLHLYHSVGGISYGFTGGNASGTYPCGGNQYFAFANTGSNVFPYGGLSEIKSWVIESNFSGHQKNIYCLLNVPAGDFINDNFTALITDGGNNLVTASVSTLPVVFGNSLDPNYIEVNKDTSNICGIRPEQLIYTVHFQNTGAQREDSINVNLELDPALDPSSLEVIDASIGSTFSVTNHSLPISKVRDYNFVSGTATCNAPNSSQHFQYSINTNRSSLIYAGSVTPDVTFRFAKVALEGTSQSLIGETQGYVRFKVNAVRPYASINNRAGIFFCNSLPVNGRIQEVITNLAVTTCMKDSVNNTDCATQLAQCHEQLKLCKSDCHNWKYWFGWMIAGIEFLILIFLLSLKKK